MSGKLRIATIGAVAATLLLPASGALAGAGPVATKSGAIVNYLTTGKLRIKKKITVPFECAVDCDVVSSLKIKGPGVKLPDVETGSLPGGVPAGHFIKPNGPLLRTLKAHPGRYRFISNITATDPATGASDTISHSFRLKR